MIQVIRENALIDFDQEYEIWIDDELVALVGNNAVKGITVPDGEHTIQVKCGKRKSKKLKAKSNSETSTEFDCKAKYKSEFMKKWYSLLGSGISLSRRGDFYI